MVYVDGPDAAGKSWQVTMANRTTPETVTVFAVCATAG
jgi:hypothetical protein